MADQNSNPNANNSQEPQVNGLQANQSHDSASKAEAEKKAGVPCRCFGKKHSGCPKGRNCVFKHDESGILEKPPRCKSCADLGYNAQDCPNSKGISPRVRVKARVYRRWKR